jgi:hypothetical protein
MAALHLSWICSASRKALLTRMLRKPEHMRSGMVILLVAPIILMLPTKIAGAGASA